MQQIIKIWKENKIVKWMILAEILIMCFFAGMIILRENKVVEYQGDTLQASFGNYDSTLGGYHVSAEDGANGEFVCSPLTSVRAGIYRVELQYMTDSDQTNRCEVRDGEISYEGLLSNGATLYTGKNTTNYKIWVLEKTDSLQVVVNYQGAGNLTITGLRIVETSGLLRMIMMILAGAFILLDCCVFFGIYDKQNLVALQTKQIVFGLMMIILFSSLPLMADYVISGGDIIFHLMRIEGVKDGILSGQFPVRIAPEWQYGYGYASSIFYGELLLYIPAFLRIMGFTVQAAYKILLLFLNVGTCLISYHCFKKIAGNKVYIGLLASLIYTLSSYRLFKMYCCAALGEAEGVMFLPLLILGFYLVFTKNPVDKDYQKAMIPLVIGFSGIIQTHLLTGELAGFFTILLCIVEIKKVVQKKTFFVLAKSVILILLLNAWFIVPFADYMVTGDFVIKHVSGRRIQSEGLSLAQMLFTFIRRNAGGMDEYQGVLTSNPIGLGIVLTGSLLLFLYLRFTESKNRNIEEKKDIKAGWILTAFSILAIIMSLYIFPWDKIQRMGGIVATLVSSIQFPNRLLSMATICLTTLFAITAFEIFNMEKKALSIGLGVGIVILTVVSNLYFMDDILHTSPFFRLYDSEGMGVAYVSGAEYLPYGMDASKLTYQGISTGENIVASEYSKNFLSMQVSVQNTGEVESYLDFPVIEYKGYRALDINTKQELMITTGDNASVRVIIPSDYKGTVKLQFVSPWYWRVAEVVTLLTALCLLGRKRKKCHV